MFLLNTFNTILAAIKNIRHQKRVVITEILSAKPRKHVKRLRKKRAFWVIPGRNDSWFQNFMDNK